MKKILLMIAVVMGQSVLAADEKLIADPIVDKLMRLQNGLKTKGELSKADLEKVTRLVLGLGGAKITDGSLKGLAKLQQLEWLALDETKITDACLKEVAKLQQLEQLNLNDTKITDAGLKDVAKLQQLKRLYLSRTQITDACLPNLAKLQNLESLVLYYTKITADGVTELKKALPKCKIYYRAKK